MKLHDGLKCIEDGLCKERLDGIEGKEDIEASREGEEAEELDISCDYDRWQQCQDAFPTLEQSYHRVYMRTDTEVEFSTLDYQV